jgi:hypothetical protein
MAVNGVLPAAKTANPQFLDARRSSGCRSRMSRLFTSTEPIPNGVIFSALWGKILSKPMTLPKKAAVA